MKSVLKQLLAFFLFSCSLSLFEESILGAEARCEILRWHGGSRMALSITYDGGTLNQFRVALPIMNEMGLPATFFIVTGEITGAKHQARFMGRPPEEILRESGTVPTSLTNFFERATAIRFLGCAEALPCHTKSGDLFEVGKQEEALRLIDEGFGKIRGGEWRRKAGSTSLPDNPDVDISWDELRKIAAQGHEFGSHSISHPQMAVTDDLNLKYELEQSKEEILNWLGAKHTFSAECPHGSEKERVMRAAQATYPALRNRMPEPYLEEINRWNKKTPGTEKKEYVQWQRGPRQSTSLDQMKEWLDASLTHENFWLVLTFHGIDGVGYEPKTSREIRDYFTYIRSKQDAVWTATFQDVTKYMRERMAAKSSATRKKNQISVRVTHNLDRALYNFPLTVKTQIPSGWELVECAQDGRSQRLPVRRDAGGSFVIHDVVPNAGPVELRPTR